MFGSIGVIAIVVALCLADPCFAVNPFIMGKVSYFNDGKSLTSELEHSQETIDWREPIMGADGKMTYYLPPDPVLGLLDNPTEINVRKYMDWQKNKYQRIARAQEAINKYQKMAHP